MIKIPIKFNINLIEQSYYLYNIINNRFINSDIFNNIDEEVIYKVMTNLKLLNYNLIIFKDIPNLILNIKSSNEYKLEKELILTIINYYDQFKQIINNNNNLNYNFVNDLFQILNIKLDYLNINDLDQFYKLNDLDYLILNNKYFKINIISNIINSIYLIEHFNIILNKYYKSYDIFKYNIKLFSEYFNVDSINKYNTINNYINDSDNKYNREIYFYKNIFNNNEV